MEGSWDRGAEFEGGFLFDDGIFRGCCDCDANVVGAKVVNVFPDSEAQFKRKLGEEGEGLKRRRCE
jgi:hypothetical protein